MAYNVIFCFSGTGNCLDIAKNIAKELGDTDIIMMKKNNENLDVRYAHRVGFVVPCHGGGLPLGLESVVRQITVNPTAYTFGVVSYCGYKGNALKQISKHVPLCYWNSVVHQSACIWLMPHTVMVPPMSPEAAQLHSEKMAKAIAADVLAGKRMKKESPALNVLNAVENAGWPMIAKAKLKEFKVSDECIGCGLCARLCPQENIRIEDGKPQWGPSCMQCLRCLQYCPKNAISCGNITKNREQWRNPNVSADELTESIIHIE